MAVTFIGNTDYEQAAPERWFPNGWELDRLIVPMQGGANQYSDFIDGLVLWEPSDVNGNMYLADWISDGDRVFPTVELIYLGKKDGADGLPPDRIVTSLSVQQVRYVSFATDPSDPAEGYDGVPAGTPPEDIGTFTLDVTYMAFNQGLIHWDIEEMDLHDVGDSVLFDGDWLISHWIALWENWPTGRVDLSGDFTDLFFLDTVTTGDQEEMVPAQYFRASVMVNSVVFPDPPALPA